MRLQFFICPCVHGVRLSLEVMYNLSSCGEPSISLAAEFAGKPVQAAIEVVRILQYGLSVFS